MPQVGPKDWVAFLEERLKSSTTWAQIGISAGGLVSTGTLVQGLSILSLNFLAALAFAGVAAVGLTVMTWYIVSFIRKRRRLLYLSTLILSGLLHTNAAIAKAYWIVSQSTE